MTNPANASPWKKVKIAEFSSLPKAGKKLEFDVVVIGGGISGLTAAYYLKQSGKKVCVLERGYIGGGDTSSTTAHVTALPDTRLSELASSFGDKNTRLMWDAGEVAANIIESIAKKHKIKCQFRRVPAYLSTSIEGTGKSKSQELLLDADLDVARRIGIDAHMDGLVPIFKKRGIRFGNQAKFNPMLYLAGLAKKIQGNGSVIFDETEVTAVESEPLRVKCGKVEIGCKYLVVMTHVPLMGKTNLVSAALFQTKIASYTSYALQAKIPTNLIPELNLYDTSDPYYYLRVDREESGDYVIFGGADHKTGQVEDTEACFKKLGTVLTGLIPNAKIVRKWSGQVVETHDGLPFIGEISSNQFIATGFSGNGMTLGTLAGYMACDAVLKKHNAWAQLFSPDRKEIVASGLWNYFKENIDYPRYLIQNNLFLKRPTNINAVKRGEGKIIKIDGKNIACYRDKKGSLCKVSAVCTHMGCLVNWNQSEKTWDCPCHGSRFDTDGAVLAGPAEDALEKM